MAAKKQIEIEDNLPQHYFAYNDDIYKHELEECIIQECESAGLNIYVDEELAEQRGYDQAFVVENPYKDKLEKVLKICEINSNKDWDNDFENKPSDEFEEIIKIIKSSNDEQH